MTADQCNISLWVQINDTNAQLEEKAELFHGALFLPLHRDMDQHVACNAMKASDSHFLIPESSCKWGVLKYATMHINSLELCPVYLAI